jgi:hypothetical protein
MKSIDLIVIELKKKGVKAQKINKRNSNVEYKSSNEKKQINRLSI